LPRNTALPAKKGAAFTTAEDNQRTVMVNIVEGATPAAPFDVDRSVR